MTLHPTKTRLALLQAIDDGAVTQQYPIMPSADYAEWDHGPGVRPRYRKVTSRVNELAKAGLVRLGDRTGDHYKAPRLFMVTVAGRMLLEANPDA